MNFDALNLRIRRNNLAYSLRPKLQWTIPDIPESCSRNSHMEEKGQKTRDLL